MELSIAAKRLKYIREDLQLTQAEFGQCLGMSTSYDMERGKTKISGEVVYRLLHSFQVNPLWLYGESEQKHLDLRSKEIIPNVLTVANTGAENILMVNRKAAAGYAGNLDNQEFYEQLPAFSFPIAEYRNASFRCFQVEGYSMTPAIWPEEWVIAEAVENINQMRDDKIYVIVDKESIRIKQIKHDKDRGILYLISLNKDYEIDQLAYDDIVEVWAFHSKLTKEIHMDLQHHKLDEISHDLKWIKEHISDRV